MLVMSGQLNFAVASTISMPPLICPALLYETPVVPSPFLPAPTQWASDTLNLTHAYCPSSASSRFTCYYAGSGLGGLGYAMRQIVSASSNLNFSCSQPGGITGSCNCTYSDLKK